MIHRLAQTMKITFQNIGHLFLKVVKLEGCQKAQAAQVKGHDRRHRLLIRQKNMWWMKIGGVSLEKSNQQFTWKRELA